jgi:hypothetical protein
MKFFSGLLFIVLLTGVAGCGGTKSVSRKTQAPGEREFRANCGSCHSLPAPSELTVNEWVPVLKQHSEMLEMEPEKEQMILRFLQQHTRVAP